MLILFALASTVCWSYAVKFAFAHTSITRMKCNSGSLSINEYYKLHILNFFRQIDNQKFLPMTKATKALKVKKLQSEFKGRRLHSGKLHHRFAINFHGLVPTLENSYLCGIDNAIIKNTVAVYLSMLYELVRVFVFQRTKGDLQFAAIDMCVVT